MFCSNCGKQLPDRARFCNACGEPIAEPSAQSTEEPVIKPVEQPAPQWEPEDLPENEPLFKPEPEPAVPEENRALGPWAYFGYGLLFSIPVVGLILLIIFSFAGKNVNRKNFARSYWCWAILLIALILILAVVVLTGVLRGVTDGLSTWLNSIGLDWLAQYFG